MVNFFNQAAVWISQLGRSWANVVPPSGMEKYWDTASGQFAGSFSFLNTIFSMIDFLLIPLMIAVCAAGAIYAVILGVNLARAEDPEKREAAKKRLIWAVIGLASIVVLIVLLNFIAGQIPGWIFGK